jgi:hypothetical protein
VERYNRLPPSEKSGLRERENSTPNRSLGETRVIRLRSGNRTGLVKGREEGRGEAPRAS